MGNLSRRAALAVGALVLLAATAAARAAGDAIKVVYDEGDVAGFSAIYGTDGRTPIGFIEYHQKRRGDVLSSIRVARYRDGSSDEDRAEARVDGTLVALRGRSIIRDAGGDATVDLQIDVAGGRITGSVGRGNERENVDEKVALPPATYWGPLIFIALKNFEANAEEGRLVFHTVAPTPRPRMLDLALVRVGPEPVERPGATVNAVRFDLQPTIHWLVDPVIQRVAPRARFFVLPGEPPALARFSGPRNYGGQEIRIE